MPTIANNSTLKKLRDVVAPGGTMTGPLFLRTEPVNAGELINKKYVDSFIINKSQSLHTHVSSAIAGLSSSLSKLNYVKNLTGNIVDVLNSKLNKTGGTVTGQVTSNATPTDTLHAVTKEYVVNKIGTASNVPTGSIVLLMNTSVNTGFFLCDGSLKSKVTYSSLYSIIGDQFTDQSIVGGLLFALPTLTLNSGVGNYNIYIKY